MSAINAFMNLNHTAMRFRQLAGVVGAVATQPPVADLAIGLASISIVTGNVGSGTIDWTITLNGTGLVGDYIELAIAGPFQSSGKVSVQGKFATANWGLGNVLTGTLSNLQPTAWYWVRIRYVKDDGQVSAWLYGQATAKV